MKKREIISISYEHLGELLGLEVDEFVSDVISSSRERCSEIVLLKLANGKKFSVLEGQEIPRIDWRNQE